MALSFDDLLPGSTGGGLSFDDLIQNKPDPEAIAKAMLTRGAMGGSSLFGVAMPDVAMGARQVLDSAAQMGARGLQAVTDPDSTIGKWARSQTQSTEDTNKAALAAYNQNFQPDATMPYGGGGVGRSVGQALVTAPVLPMGATSLPGMAAQGALAGAAGDALTPVYDPSNFGQQKLDQAKQGAIAGALTGGAAGLAGRALSPNLSPDVRTLIDSGITPTPGQIMGGLGKSTEDKLTSIPLLGDVINMGRARTLTDFNRALYARTLAPLGDEGAQVAATAPIGSEGIAKIGNFLSDKYNEVLPKITVVKDGAFDDAVGQLKQMASELPPQQSQQFNSILQSQVLNKFTDSGLMAGQTMKQVSESTLGSIARGYSGFNNDFDKQQLGSAVKQLQSISATWLRAVHPTMHRQCRPSIRAGRT